MSVSWAFACGPEGTRTLTSWLDTNRSVDALSP
jgi:hypothetical protein